MMHNRVLQVVQLVVIFCSCSLYAAGQTMSYQEIDKLPRPKADQRIPYGAEKQQFGDLRLPKGNGPFPVVIIVHGGCWFSAYDLNHLAAFSDALTQKGVATWSIEYRRVGDPGGGWPGTFLDVAAGADYLRELARKYPLDLRHVVVTGHSAGGQLALWLAERRNLAPTSPLFKARPLSVHGVVALAAVTDLKKFRPNCDDSVNKLIGGGPEQFPERYRDVSPDEILPLRVKVVLVHGEKDRIVPISLAREFELTARRKGDQVELVTFPEAGHFELVAPQTREWQRIAETILAMAGKAQK